MVQRRLSRRTFLRAGAVTTAAAFVAACMPVAPSTTGGEEAGGAASTEAATIAYWVGWGGTTAEALQKCGDAFTDRNPGITVSVVGASLNDKVLAAIAGGTPPEMGTNLDYLALIARGVCVPQSDWIDASQVIDKNDFAPESWPLFTWEGEIYGIPGVESAPRESLAYNVDLVEKAGLDPNTPPQTWDEVFVWHEALTEFDAAGNAVVIGIDPLDDMGGSVGAGDPWMWPTSWGFDYFNEEVPEFEIDRPETAEIFSTIKRFYDLVGVEKMTAFRSGYGTWTSSPTAGFPAAAQAMVVTGGWSPGWLSLSAPDKHFAYTWMPVSAARKGTKVQIWGGHTPLIFDGAKYTEEAFKFAEYLTIDDEASDILWESVGFQPARLSWWQKVDASRYEGFSFFVDAVTKADEVWPDQPNPVVSVTGDEWVKARDGVIFGDITPEQAAENMQAAVSKALQELLQT